MKTCLVLEGGGLRGIYTAGVLDVLMENDIHVDCIIGVSAGALFGVNYVSKQKGRVLRYNKKYVNDRRYMGIHSLITTGDIMNKEFCFNTIVYKLDKFDFDTYKKSDTLFYATVTNVESGKAEYILIDDLEAKMEYLRASASMPLVSKIVEIDGNKYLDGGLADSIPIKKAKELGYDNIIVVLTRPLEYRKKQVSLLPYKLMYKKYPEFYETVENRYIMYNKVVEEIIEKEINKDLFVIRPTKAIKVGRLEKDVKKIQAMYDLGVEDCNDKLDDLKRYIK